MDRKTIVILLVSIGALFTWPMLVNKILPPPPIPPKTTNAAPIVASIPNPESAPVLKASTDALAPRRPAPAPIADQKLLIEDKETRYTFSALSGGLSLIELKNYPASIDCRTKGTAGTNQLAALNHNAPSSIFALNGGPELEGDGMFALSRTADGVRAEKSLPSGLHIIKEYKLGSNSLLSASIRFENPTGQPVQLPAHELVVGNATPMTRRDESLTLGFTWFDGASPHRVTEAWFANSTLGCIPGTPRTEYQEGASNIVWVAAHNQFFSLIAVPTQPGLRLVARHAPLPPPTPEELAADSQVARQPFGFETAIVYPSVAIAPQQQVVHQFDLYAGPKEYNTLSKLPKNQDLIMGFDGFTGFFAKALLLSMNAVHTFIPSYGFAIILITVIIKLVFWPLTTASTRSMKRMSELQPQMKALQEKYKDDPKKMNTKLMEFMKENKVSPLGGCLPMLLQIPVFFGFYSMLQSAIELRGASFLWACDLSQADTVAVLPGLGFPINPMPLLMGVTMLWQARLTPPSPGMDPMQQKIMKYMPLMFMFILYKFSAGLTLYWTVQNLLTIAQMKITKTNSPASAAKVAIVPTKKPAPRKKS
ncbi:MAG: membrane protein insertase YidC [Pedosphaera sp.]|nr:membrane protein insertase YidC [Pedosphaera sp.]